MDIKEQLSAIEGIAPELIDKIAPIVQAHKEESFNAGVGRGYEEVEKTAFELYGVTKNEKEKATDFLRRSHSVYDSGVRDDAAKPYKEKLSVLEEKLKAGITDEKLKQEFEQLKETHNLTIKETEELVKKLEAEKESIRLDFNIKAGFSGLKFNIEDDDYINHKKSKFIEDAKKEFTIVETNEGLLFKGGADQQYKDYTLDQLIELKFGSMIKKDDSTQHQVNGSGAINSNTTKQNISLSKSKGDALDIIKSELISEGLTIQSPQWSDKFKEKVNTYKAELDKLK